MFRVNISDFVSYRITSVTCLKTKIEPTFGFPPTSRHRHRQVERRTVTDTDREQLHDEVPFGRRVEFVDHLKQPRVTQASNQSQFGAQS